MFDKKKRQQNQMLEWFSLSLLIVLVAVIGGLGFLLLVDVADSDVQVDQVVVPSEERTNDRQSVVAASYRQELITFAQGIDTLGSDAESALAEAEAFLFALTVPADARDAHLDAVIAIRERRAETATNLGDARSAIARIIDTLVATLN